MYLIQVKLILWTSLNGKKNAEWMKGSNQRAPYIPVRFRRKSKCNEWVNGVLSRGKEYLELVYEYFLYHMKTNRKNLSRWKQSRLKRNSHRKYSLRMVRYRNRSMYLCSLLAATSSYSQGYSNQSYSKAKQVNAYDSSTNCGKSEMQFDTDSFAIKIDNCCTRSMSHCKRDFIPGSLRPVRNLAVKGYGGSSTNITHQGTISWTIQDDTGTSQTLNIPNSFYVPSATIRLLSPQHMAQQMREHYPNKRGTWCATYDDSISLHWNQRKHTKTVKLDPKSSNVGTIWSVPGYHAHNRFCARMALSVENWNGEAQCYEVNLDEESILDTHVENKGIEIEPGEEHHTNRTDTFLVDGPAIKDATDKPEVFSSASEELLLWHQKLSHVSMARLQRMATYGDLPKYLATCKIPLCQSCLYGKQTKTPWRTKSPKKQLKLTEITQPGDCVSVDQLESSTLGLVGQMKGSLTKNRYKVATIFVDHFSNLGYVHLQMSTNAIETLQAKVEFEKFARTYGVTIRHYHADNGRFSDTHWREDVLNKGQRLSFCGVGAHHQNGRAEKRIRDAQDNARTSLIHANRRWPDAIDARLWPYALRQAIDSMNRTPFPSATDGETPYELFSSTKVKPDLQNEHPFGCPAYALDGRLQSGNKINKWASRSRLAVYIGHSPQHARSVGLLLSLSTGLVSPQFHVKYDDNFATIRPDNHQPRSKWQALCGFESDDSVLTQDTTGQLPVTAMKDQESVPMHNNERDVEIVTPASVTVPTPIENIDVAVNPEEVIPIQARDSAPVQVTRSGREVRAPTKYDDYVSFVGEVEESIRSEPEVSYCHPLALAASSDPDVMYMHQALAAPDRKEFIKAMEKEIRAHTENSNWKIINRSDVPRGQTVLPSVWAMRRKRDIATQQVYKWKARLNVHGGKQIKDVNYWDTYAPVASWSSIRVVMNMAALHGWVTRQLDFVLAFPQAPVETDIYIEIPSGFEVKGSRKDLVLKLVNNLYGQKQAGRVWNTYLTEGLENIGFHQCKNDPCIFWREQTMIIIYTDDTIVTGPNTDQVDKAIQDIGNAFEITHQPTVKDFLGVRVQRTEDGLVILSQPQLIKSIIADLGLKDNSNSRAIPALSSKILQKHLDSPGHNEKWHYRSVIGKLNYLEKSTRPDLAYAVHQCARFAADPREEHTKAVKVIGRYLMGTADKGIICTPSNESFMCYCDADFSGNWDSSIAEYDTSTARSRSGYLVNYAGCPVVWASRLQTEIALSSTESEYVALSQALREVIPLMRLITELADAGFDFPVEVPQVHCKVFEDNSGALEMARVPKMRPRTKHMNLKYHHFREAVQDGKVSIHAISTHDQLADIFTKPLAVELFCKFRYGIMGW
jgi:Reverse transcriptase (RNA-dependent DNA polymerase)/GAG-pre-integrase domain